MGTNANPLDDPADAAALLDAVDAALPAWVEQMVTDRWRSWSGLAPSPELAAITDAAGAAARAEAMPSLRALLEADVEQQRTNPLSILRQVAHHATEVLAAAGVAPLVRDVHATRLFPKDDYDLGPAAFADLGADVHEAGLVWGAAKAHVVMARHRGPS